jgi:uncharacterized membrane protein (DUF485 family)
MATPPSTEGVITSQYIKWGDHVDTVESVDLVFKEQRKLSFTYGAVFFIVTLAVPLFTVVWEAWWKTEIWGGFTANYLLITLLYYLFLWTMAWTYSKRADKLDDTLAKKAEAITAAEAAKAAQSDQADSGHASTTNEG